MLTNFRPDLSKIADYAIGIGAGLLTAGIIVIAMVAFIFVVFK